MVSDFLLLARLETSALTPRSAWIGTYFASCQHGRFDEFEAATF
jgi:hypothetical protein